MVDGMLNGGPEVERGIPSHLLDGRVFSHRHTRDRLLESLSLKWGASCETLVEDHSERIDIGAPVDGLRAIHLFGSHIDRGAEEGTPVGDRIRYGHRGDEVL